jgi:hypothetical protein
MTTFVGRLKGAAFLNRAVFEEIEADRSATMQAMGVVVLSSLAAGIGLQGAIVPSPASLAVTSGLALMLWVIWALLTYQIGTRILPSSTTHSDPGELLRTIGFASAPGIIRIGGVIPGLAWPLFGIAAVWMLVAMIVAVRQALDYTNTGRAMAVCGLGWMLTLGLAIGIGVFCSPPLH